MAKGQRVGLNSTTVGMVAFAALWLASSVLLIFLYTGQEALNNENGRLLAENGRLISPNEQRSIELVKSAQEGGPTVVGLIEGARSQTAELATGDAADSPATVRTKRDQLLRTIRTEALVAEADSFEDLSYQEALARLYSAYTAESGLRRAAEERTSQLESEKTKLVEADAARKNDFDRRAEEASRQLAQCESDRAAYRTERDRAIEGLERDLEESRRRSTEDVTRERLARQAAEQKLTEVQQRVAVQQEKLGGLLIGPEELATARQPDGKILTAIPGDEVVYIDLGEQNTLTLGLQFTVYSAKTGIPPDGRGKARIEVVSISPESAECRIMGVAPGQVILEGDLIANPVYDPNRPPTFIVVGEFDLDGDGAIDRNGAATLESLIREWGGRVATEVTPLTDFVVLGTPPRRPRAAADATSTGAGAPTGQGAGTQDAWTKYQEIAAAAKSMSVPVLTQNVFLNFLGYSDRQVRR